MVFLRGLEQSMYCDHYMQILTFSQDVNQLAGLVFSYPRA